MEEAGRTRTRIIDEGVAKASSEGLEGVTIGALAKTLGMSKAGVIGPFGSRQTLQDAILTRAVEVFTAEVLTPSFSCRQGRARVEKLVDRWVDYLADGPFPNGCFLTAASSEMDARPGPLNEKIRDAASWWRAILREEIATAVDSGELDTDPDDAVLTLIGLAAAANHDVQLLGRTESIPRTRRLMRKTVGIEEPESSGRRF